MGNRPRQTREVKRAKNIELANTGSPVGKSGLFQNSATILLSVSGNDPPKTFLGVAVLWLSTPPLKTQLLNFEN